MKLRRPVKVLAILTENLRQGLFQELDQQLLSIDRALDELAWRRKRLENEVASASISQAEALQQLEQERRHALEARQKLNERRREIAALSLGVEMLHSTVEAEIKVAVGDNWEERVHPEIVLLDGRIVAIRGIEREEC